MIIIRKKNMCTSDFSSENFRHGMLALQFYFILIFYMYIGF